MTRLRVLLPRLDELDAGVELEYAAYEREDRPPRQRGRLRLADLGHRHAGASIDAVLHPADVTMADVTLPPLPAGKMHTAVAGMVEPYLLGDPATTAIGHGKRAASGRVGVAWLNREQANAARHLFRHAGLHVRAVWPTPFMLPCPEKGWTASLIDGYAVVRTAAGEGFVFPVDAFNTEPGIRAPGIQRLLDHVRQLAPPLMAWRDAIPAWWPLQELASSTYASDACWTTPRAPWAIEILGADGDALSGQGWGRAAAWAALGVLVWVVGLNLYAERLERTGHAQASNNVSRVQQLFPALRTVVDPLRQARQQLEVQQTAAGDPAADLSFLLGVAQTHMGFAQGQVRAIRFTEGALDLDLMPGASGAPQSANLTAAAVTGGPTSPQAAPPPPPVWAGPALQAGAQVEATPAGWRLRRAPAGAAPAPRPAAAATLAHRTP